MKMANIQEVYTSVNILLEDICKFLSDDKLKGISLSDRRIADALILRSKVQLEQIAKITNLNNKCIIDTEYVDMQRNPVVSTSRLQEKQNVIYHTTSTDESGQDSRKSSTKQSRIELSVVSPYKDLPAKDASKSVKSGYISMRRKVILNFETMRRVYATIHNKWLLIYSKEKDLKPKFAFDLGEHKAQETNSDATTCQMFELLSSSSDEKYHFTAQTHKDMLQWVSYINSCHNRSILPQVTILNDSGEEELEEHYDSINSPNNNEDDDDENIYVEIVRNTKNLETAYKPKTEEKPPLPGRRPSMPRKIASPLRKFVPPPVIPSARNSDDSAVTYDAVGGDDENNVNSPISPTSSFSGDDDSDNVYESFVHKKETVEKLLKGVHGGPLSPGNYVWPPPPEECI